MAALHGPWLELSVLIALAGSLITALIPDPARCRRVSLAICIGSLAFTLAAWLDFATSQSTAAAFSLFGMTGLVIDDLSAPLLSLAALQFLLTVLSTLKTKVGRFSFSSALFLEGVTLALLGSQSAPGVLLFLLLATIPPWLDLRIRKQSTRAYALYFSLFALLLVGGQLLFVAGNSSVGIGLLTAGLLLRCGVFPLHGWAGDLMRRASFGTALLYLAPMSGVYAFVRLVLPEASDATLQVVSILSLLTAAYAAAMTLVQTEARGFFTYLFLSYSSLVLVGLSVATPISLTGAMCAWLSIQLSLIGLGITLRCVEARIGPVSLTQYHGFYDHMPMLAALFLLTGLASIGFPGTIGFIAGEILLDGVVTASPLVGMLVAVIGALNGIAVLKAYFRIFNGRSRVVYFSIGSRRAERWAISIIAVLIVAGGLFPQLGTSSCFRAAQQFARDRHGAAEHHPPLTAQHQTPAQAPPLD